jgi:bacteriocin biosynthesis cyclodehydratase domain-containing protein
MPTGRSGVPSDDASSQATRYRALPVQLVEIDGGVILVRGGTEVRVVGMRAEQTVREIWSAATQAPITLEGFVATYAAPDRASVRALVEKLIARRILIDADTERTDGPESALEVFYWNFGLAEPRVRGSLNERRMVVLGLNGISRQLTATLTEAGVTNFEVVDYALFRNQRLFGSELQARTDHWPSSQPEPIAYDAWIKRDQPGNPDCLIATCEHAATSVMLDWNRYCVENNIAFLPIVLRQLIGQVGPFVVPQETACYECLCARQNSHLREHQALRSVEAQSPYGQAVSGVFPAMGSILGDIAAFELVKFYSGGMPYRVGHFIEVNLLAVDVTTHKVLRVPRCRACAATMKTSGFGLEFADFVPGPQFLPGDTTRENPVLSPEETPRRSSVEN